MKKRRSKAADYQEEYLLNTAAFEPERQGISVHSFCHSVLLPNFNSVRGPMPYILADLVLSGEENYLNGDGDRIVRKPGFFSIVDQKGAAMTSAVSSKVRPCFLSKKSAI